MLSVRKCNGMTCDREREIVRYLSAVKFDEVLDETDNEKVIRWLCLIKTFSIGDTLEEVTSRVGISQPS